tara:strand:+ start:606 stop:770 length:165 start_codon:yes stop_codon:yes gene_type:complete
MAEKGINEADHALLRTISLSSPNQSWPLHHIESVALSLIKKLTLLSFYKEAYSD